MLSLSPPTPMRLRPRLLLALLALPLAACDTAGLLGAGVEPKPTVAFVDIVSASGKETRWRADGARFYADAQAGSVWLEGPEGDRFRWSLSLYRSGGPLAAGTYEVASRPDDALAWTGVEASFSGGVMAGGDCGTPSWDYRVGRGTVTITSATAERVEGTYRLTLAAPYAGPFGDEVRVQGTFRALAPAPPTG